jgi:hypothetical protein
MYMETYLKQREMSFFFQKQRLGRQNRSYLGGLIQWEKGGYKERVQEGECGKNIMCLCMKMEK